MVTLFYDFNGGGDGLDASVFTADLVEQLGSSLFGVMCGVTAASRGLFDMSTRDFLARLDRFYGKGPQVLKMFEYWEVGVSNT